LRTGITNGYFLVKGLVERVATGLGAPVDYVRGEQPFLHPGRSAEIRDRSGRPLGWVGEVHPLVAQAYDLRGPVTAAELDVDGLFVAVEETVAFADLPGYPAVEQDLALVVPADVPAAALVDAVRRAGGALLEDVSIFDLYEGSQVDEGKKSVALRLSFRAADRTLSEAEVNQHRVAMLRDVAKELGAELRA